MSRNAVSRWLVLAIFCCSYFLSLLHQTPLADWLGFGCGHCHVATTTIGSVESTTVAFQVRGGEESTDSMGRCCGGHGSMRPGKSPVDQEIDGRLVANGSSSAEHESSEHESLRHGVHECWICATLAQLGRAWLPIDSYECEIACGLVTTQAGPKVLTQVVVSHPGRGPPIL
jgi:hypothetical protein